MRERTLQDRRSHYKIGDRTVLLLYHAHTKPRGAKIRLILLGHAH